MFEALTEGPPQQFKWHHEGGTRQVVRVHAVQEGSSRGFGLLAEAMAGISPTPLYHEAQFNFFFNFGLIYLWLLLKKFVHTNPLFPLNNNAFISLEVDCT